MARLTHMIRGIVQQGFSSGQGSQNVTDLYEASKKTLVPELSVDDFADMFAQTLAYGLFAARVNHVSGRFQRRSAGYDISSANPFLREIFSLVAGPNAETEPFIGFVDDLAYILAESDMVAILADFGKQSAHQDPVMHFYETFLAAYDPEIRERRGVYYTPEPVVSYIVRAVDHLLRKNFNCPEGLADYQATQYEALEQDESEKKTVKRESHRVLVLDPACGTGLQFVRDGKGDLRQTFGPEDVLHYIYAVFHSPTYRERYAQFLRYDFPRVPTIDDVERLRALVGLWTTHDRCPPDAVIGSDPTSPSIGFPVAGDNIVEKAHPKYYPPGEKPTGRDPVLQRGRVYISSDDARGNRHGQYFEGVSPEVWKFRIGGYQPLDKWLKDRKGRALTFADIAHYRRIYAALERTIDLMAEIDEIVIDAKMLG